MRILYLFSICCVLLSSCGLRKNTYIAPLPNTPKFTKAKEAYFNTAASPTHIEFQGGVSITKNIGVTAGRFYGFGTRWSNELGLNLFTHIASNFYIGNTFSWGQSQLNNAFSHPIKTTEYSTLVVGYKTLSIQPGIYYVKEIEEGVFRVGVFVKYSKNNLSNYYYREYEYVFHTTRLIDEGIYTAESQNFNAFTPTLSLEFTQGAFSIGSHFGFTRTSEINTNYKYEHFNAPRLNKEYKTSKALHHFPLVLSTYIGIRI